MIRKSLEWFGGSVLVYVLVAACSGAAKNGDLDMGSGGMLSMLTSGDGDGDSATTGSTTTGSSSGDGDTTAMGKGDVTTGASDPTTGSNTTGDGGGSMMTGIVDPVPDADAAEDGTRIVNLYRTTEGGLKTQEGYFDAELALNCSFQTAEDGKDRCLPLYGGVTVVFFSDSGCTKHVGNTATGQCVTGKYTGYNQTRIGSCSGNGGTTYYQVIAYEVGAKLVGQTIYTGTPEACTELSDTLYDIYDFYSLTKVPATAFAEGTLVHD